MADRKETYYPVRFREIGASRNDARQRLGVLKYFNEEDSRESHWGFTQLRDNPDIINLAVGVLAMDGSPFVHYNPPFDKARLTRQGEEGEFEFEPLSMREVDDFQSRIDAGRD
jgi:hypothetical protein